MANTVFLTGSRILQTVAIKASGRLTMLGIELAAYACVLLLFTAVQYICLLAPALKA